jgi:hypothetical protein
MASSPRSERLAHEIEVVGTRTRCSIRPFNRVSNQRGNGLARPSGLRVECVALFGGKRNLCS